MKTGIDPASEVWRDLESALADPAPGSALVTLAGWVHLHRFQATPSVVAWRQRLAVVFTEQSEALCERASAELSDAASAWVDAVRGGLAEHDFPDAEEVWRWLRRGDELELARWYLGHRGSGARLEEKEEATLSEGWGLLYERLSALLPLAARAESWLTACRDAVDAWPEGLLETLDPYVRAAELAWEDDRQASLWEPIAPLARAVLANWKKKGQILRFPGPPTVVLAAATKPTAGAVVTLRFRRRDDPARGAVLRIAATSPSDEKASLRLCFLRAGEGQGEPREADEELAGRRVILLGLDLEVDERGVAAFPQHLYYSVREGWKGPLHAELRLPEHPVLYDLLEDEAP